jgi:hypothetical protein
VAQVVVATAVNSIPQVLLQQQIQVAVVVAEADN